MVVNGGVSFWWQQVGIPDARPALDRDLDVDVCIVGAGYTGLWTALSIARADPSVRVAVLERRFAGFGASGRNGGWLTNSVTGGVGAYAAAHGARAASAMQQALNDSVHTVIATCEREGIEADIALGGELTIARTPAQLARLREEAEFAAAWPVMDVEVLSAERAADRVAASDVLGGLWHPHCARIHPAKLVAGLASAVEAAGVTIFENTAALEIRPGVVVTDRGNVRAPAILRATEGFTPDIRGQHRTWLPMNSSMIVTDPIPADVWHAIGWEGRETLGDMAHVYMYAQRTADDRIAFGGRGVPYRFGSKVDDDGSTQPRTIDSLTRLLREFFPAARDVPIAHAWAGVLGVPRDWRATVGFDRSTGLGWAGGYVGTGVTATNLAGRTLADLVLERDTDITNLAWVGHRARSWEIEPLRWLAVHGIYSLYGAADAREAKSGTEREALAAKLAGVVAGR